MRFGAKRCPREREIVFTTCARYSNFQDKRKIDLKIKHGTWVTKNVTYEMLRNTKNSTFS